MSNMKPQNAKFIWDFWYHYDHLEELFHVLYLNADRAEANLKQHHQHSKVGYAVTRNFVDFEYIDNEIFQANFEGWDNTSIWTGDLIKLSDRYLLYYTSRNRNEGDGFSQRIGAAYSVDLREWKRIPDMVIRPDPIWYETETVSNDDSIHAWRDPFLFVQDEEIYMIVSAKARRSEVTTKGTIGLLKADNKSLLSWVAQPPLYAPNSFSEMEVPQIYRNGGKYTLVFSSWGWGDRSDTHYGKGGLISIDLMIENGIFRTMGKSRILVPTESGLYASRVVPELQGEIVGFDVQRGGIRRSNITTNLSRVDRDFTGYNLRI